MLFIYSTPVLIRHLCQLKTVAFLHWCLIRAVHELEGSNPTVIGTERKFWKDKKVVHIACVNTTLGYDNIKGLFDTEKIPLND